MKYSFKPKKKPSEMIFTIFPVYCDGCKHAFFLQRVRRDRECECGGVLWLNKEFAERDSA